MTRILYFDPWSGASGDMVLAALIDAADPASCAEEALGRAVRALALPGVAVEVERGDEGGFACRRLTVHSREVQPRRHLADLESLLDAADLDPLVAQPARAALRRLAEVEAVLHGVSVDQVHFHELGAVDTVVDVLGAFVLLRHLGIDQAFHGPVPLGSGTVVTEHGSIGVPAPATLALLQGRPVYGGETPAELTTPTGALLLTQAALPRTSLPPMRIERVGYGAGRRRSRDRPNLLRVVVGQLDEAAAHRGLDALGCLDTIVLQTAIDDATPEALARLQAALLREGALDAWWAPIVMKKGRPGTELTVVAPVSSEARLVEVIFALSTSFGIRRSVVGRHTLERSFLDVTVEGNPVRVKVGRWADRVVTLAAEYEDAAAAADLLGLPLEEVMAEAVVAARSVARPAPPGS